MIEGLIPSISLDALLIKRDAMVGRLTRAHGALQELETLGNALLGVLEHDTPRFNAMTLEDRRTLRPDLVDQCNKIIAKHHPNALPPKERE